MAACSAGPSANRANREVDSVTGNTAISGLNVTVQYVSQSSRPLPLQQSQSEEQRIVMMQLKVAAITRTLLP
jgi:hypothetical protein